MILSIEVPANLEILLKEKPIGWCSVESFVLQAIKERLGESEAPDSIFNAEEFSSGSSSGRIVFQSSTMLSTIVVTRSTLDAVNNAANKKRREPDTMSDFGASCHKVGHVVMDHEGGGHGTRTRNPLRGTSFPMKPLAIRLPSRDSASGKTCLLSAGSRLRS